MLFTKKLSVIHAKLVHKRDIQREYSLLFCLRPEIFHRTNDTYHEKENRECTQNRKPNQCGWTTNKKKLDPFIFNLRLKRKQNHQKDICNGIH